MKSHDRQQQAAISKLSPPTAYQTYPTALGPGLEMVLLWKKLQLFHELQQSMCELRD
jgi:hypothetical protein